VEQLWADGERYTPTSIAVSFCFLGFEQPSLLLLLFPVHSKIKFIYLESVRIVHIEYKYWLYSI